MTVCDYSFIIIRRYKDLPQLINPKSGRTGNLLIV